MSKDDDDDITRNYHRGNPRSVEAHETTKPKKQADYLRIITTIRKYSNGLICDEAEQILAMSHQTCSARFSDMKNKGWLFTRGTRKTRSGCDADIHFETPNEIIQWIDTADWPIE